MLNPINLNATLIAKIKEEYLLSTRKAFIPVGDKSSSSLGDNLNQERKSGEASSKW